MPTTFLKNSVNVDVDSTNISLYVTGIPNAATPDDGSQPANTLTVQGTTGEETTGAGKTAGVGAEISIVGGAGGAAPSGSTNGAGGSVVINPGLPGTGAGTGAAYGNVLLATEGGNIGVGTTTPSAKLKVSVDLGMAKAAFNVSNDVDQDFQVRNTASGAPDKYALIGPSTSTNLAFGFNGGERMRLNNAGYLGIGTNAPDVKLDIAGANDGRTDGRLKLRSNKSGWGTITTLLQTTAGGSTSLDGLTVSIDSGFVSLAPGGGIALTALHGGDVGIGTTAPSSRLHVNGGVQVGAPTGGDKGAGSINVAGDIYKNGTPLLAKLDQAIKTITQLEMRINKLEAAIGNKPKAPRAPKTRKTLSTRTSRKRGKR